MDKPFFPGYDAIASCFSPSLFGRTHVVNSEEPIMFRLLNRTVLYLYILVTSIIVSLNIFFSRGYQSIGLPVSLPFKIATLAGSLIMIALIMAWRGRIISFARKVPERYSLAILLSASVCLQLTAAALFSVHPSWDFGVIVKSARQLTEGEKLGIYFISYPNNIFIVTLLAFLGKLLKPSLIVYICFNIAVITLSQYFIYRIAAKVAGKSMALIGLLAAVLFFPYIFYAPIVYTDTLSLIFLVFPLNLLLDQQGQLRSRVSIILTASAVFAFGVLLKGLLIVFVIAFSLTLLIFLKKWNRLYFIVPLAILLLVQSVFSFCIYGSGIVDRQQVTRYSFPVTHWIVMGQNQPHYGKYLRSDVNHTENLLKTHSRNAVIRIQLNQLRDRITQRGWAGNFHFLVEKLSETWTDGTYYALNVLKRKPVFPKNFQHLIQQPVASIVQGYARIQLLVLMTGVLLAARSKRNAFLIFSMLSVIGFFFFLIIWETRSRYLVSLTPLLILLSMIGYFNQSADAENERQ